MVWLERFFIQGLQPATAAIVGMLAKNQQDGVLHIIHEVNYLQKYLYICYIKLHVFAWIHAMLERFVHLSRKTCCCCHRCCCCCCCWCCTTAFVMFACLDYAHFFQKLPQKYNSCVALVSTKNSTLCTCQYSPPKKWVFSTNPALQQSRCSSSCSLKKALYDLPSHLHVFLNSSFKKLDCESRIPNSSSGIERWSNQERIKPWFFGLKGV